MPRIEVLMCLGYGFMAVSLEKPKDIKEYATMPRVGAVRKKEISVRSK